MPDKVRPIKPEDIAIEKERTFPDVVFGSFNELITQKWNGNYAIFQQDDVIALMVEKGLKREEIFDKDWLNVEDVYESVGWRVEYDRPAYNESYPTTLTFTRK